MGIHTINTSHDFDLMPLDSTGRRKHLISAPSRILGVVGIPASFMEKIRIYFGRMPENCEIIDTYFHEILFKNNYCFDDAVHELCTRLKDGNYYTSNALLLNYFSDDFAKECIWIIDEDGNHIFLGNDAHMLEKLKYMQVGEVICDDHRSFL